MGEIAELFAALVVGIALGVLFTTVFFPRVERQSELWGTRRLDDVPGGGGGGENSTKDKGELHDTAA